MLLKLHISFGLKKGRQFKTNFSCSVGFDTFAVRNSLSYAEQTSVPVVNLPCKYVLYITYLLTY